MAAAHSSYRGRPTRTCICARRELSFAALAVLAAALLLAPAYAQAQTGSSVLVAPVQSSHRGSAAVSPLGNQVDREHPAAFSLSGKLASGVGQGSFVADPYARNPYLAWTAAVVPAYYPRPDVTLSVFVEIAQELTDSDVDSRPQQLLLNDTQVRGRYVIDEIPVLRLHAQLEGRLILPTSLASRFQTLVLGAEARFALLKALGPISLGYAGSFRKNFHRYQTAVLDADRGDQPPPLYTRSGGAQDLPGSMVAIGSNNVSFTFTNVLFLSYVPVPKLSLTLYYGLANAFTYASYEKGALSSPYAEGGRGRRDTAAAGLELRYRHDARLAFSAGVSTSASPKTDDNQSFRFPFYDVSGTANNLTLFYLDVTVSEFLGG